MTKFGKLIKEINLRDVILFLVKIAIIVLCRYCMEESTIAWFQKPFVAHLLQGILFFFMINIIISILSLFIKTIYIANNKVSSNIPNNFVLGISRIANMLNVIVAIIAIMIGLSINPLHFITSISIVAAAIALLSKDYITNMINGLILMFSSRLTLGDYIVVDKTKGKIIDITFLSVLLMDDEGDLHMIPNTAMLSSIVINQSHHNYKKSYIDFHIDNNLGITFEEIEEALTAAAAPYSKYYEKNSLALKPKELDFQFVKYRFIFNLKNEYIDKERMIKNDLLKTIIAFNKLTKQETK